MRVFGRGVVVVVAAGGVIVVDDVRLKGAEMKSPGRRYDDDDGDDARYRHRHCSWPPCLLRWAAYLALVSSASPLCLGCSCIVRHHMGGARWILVDRYSYLRRIDARAHGRIAVTSRTARVGLHLPCFGDIRVGCHCVQRWGREWTVRWEEEDWSA